MVRNRLALGILALAVPLTVAAGPAFGAQPPTTPPDSTPDAVNEEAIIPKAPSAPPRLLTPKQVESFGCDRYFTYKGRSVTCDSDVRRDAENLRVVVRDVPAAVAELDRYDYNREHVKTAAYFGSAGLLVAIMGALLARTLNQNNAATIRNLSVIGGLSITAGSFIYGSGVVHENEAHIGNAVADFNAVHPESPIELQFSTGISF